MWIGGFNTEKGLECAKHTENAQQEVLLLTFLLPGAPGLVWWSSIAPGWFDLTCGSGLPQFSSLPYFLLLGSVFHCEAAPAPASVLAGGVFRISLSCRSGLKGAGCPLPAICLLHSRSHAELLSMHWRFRTIGLEPGPPLLSWRCSVELSVCSAGHQSSWIPLIVNFTAFKHAFEPRFWVKILRKIYKELNYSIQNKLYKITIIYQSVLGSQWPGERTAIRSSFQSCWRPQLVERVPVWPGGTA